MERNVPKSRVGTIHVLAECRGCGKIWDNYKTAVASARAHAEKTGHKVHVERAQAWTYN